MTSSYPTALTMPADPRATERGIAWALSQVKRGHRVLVWAPGKQNIRGNSSIAAFTKRPGVKVETPRARFSDWQGGPVLACWPSAEDLAQLVTRDGVTALCVLGWNDKDLSAWMAHAVPEFLSPGVEVPAGPPRLDPIVVEAAPRPCREDSERGASARRPRARRKRSAAPARHVARAHR